MQGIAIGRKIKSTNNGQSGSINAFTDNGGYKRFDAGLVLVAGYKTPNNIGPVTVDTKEQTPKPWL